MCLHTPDHLARLCPLSVYAITAVIRRVLRVYKVKRAQDEEHFNVISLLNAHAAGVVGE